MIEAQPIRWTLCFDETGGHWLSRWIPGRFKHVRAFGFVPVQDIWIFYDVTLKGTVLRAARFNTAAAGRLLSAWSANSQLVSIEPVAQSRRFPCGFWCVTAIKHLIGLRSGALRPDALWRDCLEHGAVTLDEARCAPDATSAAA